MPGHKEDELRKRKHAAATLSQDISSMFKKTKQKKIDTASSASSHAVAEFTSPENSELRPTTSNLPKIVDNVTDEQLQPQNLSEVQALDRPMEETHELKNDLGQFIQATMLNEEVIASVKNMSDSQKYHLLKNHIKPSSNYNFPKKLIGGCHRSFKHKWFDEYGWWLVYSCKVDGVFCISCALFAKTSTRKQMGVMVNSPFSKWHHKSDVISKHSLKPSHLESIQDAEAFMHSIEKPQMAIPAMIDTRKAANIAENRHIVKAVAEAVLYCGRQCIALRGNFELLGSNHGNPGNFLSLMKLLSNHDERLKEHMNRPKLKNATYLSPHTQNEMIEVLAKHIIQAELVKEIMEAEIYSILADEVTSHNCEIMPLCIRFVDNNLNIREELLQMCTLPRITGEHIAKTIKDTLTHLGIPITQCRGQGYDGASNMRSDNVGVQAIIKKDSPKAVYTHCAGHCLNLVIAHSCNIPIVRNTIEKVKSAVLFFKFSPKKENLLMEVATKGTSHPMGQRKPIIDLCRVRWAARHDAYSHFYNSYVFIVQSLEVIALGLHTNEYSTDVTSGWIGKCKTEASGILSGIEKFDFIVTFITIYQFLSHLAGITVKLQSTSQDIINAFTMVDEVKTFYKELRKTVDADFALIYDQAVRMASQIGTEPTKPRTAGRQEHRANAPGDNVKDYYLRNMAIPFLDHIITEFNAQFSELSVKASKLLGLIPSIVSSKAEQPDITSAVDIYKEDLPSPELIDQELKRWKIKWQGKSADDIPTSCAQAIKQCDSQMYPNIFKLLKIACTLPVTSCECERSASTLRRLHTFLRASMSENRLSSLALLHTHYDMAVDLDKAVDIFAKLHSRKMELESVLEPKDDSCI